MLAHVFPIGARLPRDRHLVGGKAAGLGDLCRAGAPVPDGVVVVVPARLSSCAEIMQIVYRLLGSDPDDASLFAVRSSTVLEDGPDSSYAGMFQTFLNVSRSKIWSAVQECMRAIHSERVLAYRGSRYAGEDWPDAVPVIIQRMVPATAAGVAFTTNPISGNPHHYTIEAAPGLGEAVVSGAITPDLYVVDIRTGALVEFEKGDWPGAQDGRALNSSQLSLLVELMRLMHLRVSYEIDIEFAFHDQELFALQMRPITALPNQLSKSVAS